MADGASSADPYASQKNNIRDTVKYMAAAYAACGTVIFTGISLSGLGSLPLERLLPALLTGFAAIASVFAAIESIVDMLIGDFSFPSTLDGAARAYIDQNATDLLPAGCHSYDNFLVLYRNAVAAVETQRNAWRALPPLPPPGDPDREAQETNEKLVKDAYDQAIATVNFYRGLLSQTVSFGHLFLLQEKLKALRSRLTTLTLFGLAAFAVTVFLVTRKSPCLTCDLVTLSAWVG